jgi:hypothetical protein
LPVGPSFARDECGLTSCQRPIGLTLCPLRRQPLALFAGLSLSDADPCLRAHVESRRDKGVADAQMFP